MTNTVYFDGIARDDASTTSSSDVSLQKLPSTGQAASSPSLYKVIGKAITALIPRRSGSGDAFNKNIESVGGASPAFAGMTMEESGGSSPATPAFAQITMDKSVEFSYEELAEATNSFNLANKIHQGGFGAVYYAELRGEKAAIKAMDMQASKEFLAELKVLTNVHHLNLVRLIGYCVDVSLFLVYEFAENGNLSQHLSGSPEMEPLPWSTRVQIALDSAIGLEYIHEHTFPVYIHRDVNAANILIDKNYHGKVAGFGLTKLTAAGISSLQARLVGTFGYMAPEYAQYGNVSQKFEEVLNLPEPKDKMHTLVDPRLTDNYPIDSVCKMAQLAKACTHQNPDLRPSMRSVVVALMTLSSSPECWLLL